MIVWQKLTAAKWEDAWLERLSFIDPTRLVVTALPGAKRLRVEAWDLTKKQAVEIVKRFGGSVREVKPRKPSEQAPRKREPIRIRQRMLIVSSPAEKTAWEEKLPGRIVLSVPAEMAFGTGEHATTSTCLRFLCDLKLENWEMLDLGTGSGILGMAARALGASKVEAYDFDPHAVRTAKQNVRSNGIRRMTVGRVDVTQWKPGRTWDVVAANLYSEVLIQAAPVITRAVRPGGTLIFSGLLRTQEKACVAAFRKVGFAVERLVRKGKWVTGMATKKVAFSVDLN